MKPEGSLPCSQAHATGLFPEPVILNYYKNCNIQVKQKYCQIIGPIRIITRIVNGYYCPHQFT
jgi:hypothetical protein